MKKMLISLIILLAVLFSGCTTNSQTENVSDIPEMQEDEQTDHMSVVGTTNQFLSIVGTKSNLEVTSQMVTYHNDVQGYLTRPDDNNNYPGIILIHEWWGLNDNIKAVADTLAKEGYVVLAVDLYNGEVAQNASQAMQLRTSVNNTLTVENMKSGISYLREEENITNVASLGFCFGGEQSALLSISDAQLDATAIYYGSLPQEIEEIEKVDAPVLGIFGELDSGITPENVNVFRSGLNELGMENNITIYEGVGHAFANPSGSRFAENQTKDAWEKTINFFNSNLK